MINYPLCTEQKYIKLRIPIREISCIKYISHTIDISKEERERNNLRINHIINDNRCCCDECASRTDNERCIV